MSRWHAKLICEVMFYCYGVLRDGKSKIIVTIHERVICQLAMITVCYIDINSQLERAEFTTACELAMSAAS